MTDPIESAADAAATALDADILFFTGSIDQASWLATVLAVGALKRKRTNVLLVLVTPGGDPDAAFKIGRLLQMKYAANVLTFIPGWCKSAGTLVTLASKRLFIGDCGELGPLDIQLAKPDELFEMASGLSVQSAFETLEATASNMFIRLLLTIRGDTGRGVTTRTAAELAANLVGSLLEPIYRQIEPVKIGENQRAMSITKNYGVRLARTSGLLKDKRVIDFLVSAYPDHGFVIDREEAGELFTNVNEPTLELEALAEALGDKGLIPSEGSAANKGSIRFLSNQLPDTLTTPAAKIHKDGTHDRQKQPVRARSAAPEKRLGDSRVGNAKSTRGGAKNGHASNIPDS